MSGSHVLQRESRVWPEPGIDPLWCGPAVGWEGWLFRSERRSIRVSSEWVRNERRSATIVVRHQDYPASSEWECHALADALARLEEIRWWDPAWAARVDLLLRAAPRSLSAGEQARRVRSDIARASPVPEVEREPVPCSRCGRTFDCTCGS